MEEVTYSTLLQTLMQSAEEIGPGEKAPFTAERFVITVLDMFMDHTRVCGSKEVNNMVQSLNTNICGREAARNVLYAYVCRNNDEADKAYINRVLGALKEEMGQIQKKELTADALLYQIFHDPSEPIRKLLNYPDGGPVIDDAMGRLDWVIRKLDALIAKKKGQEK